VINVQSVTKVNLTKKINTSKEVCLRVLIITVLRTGTGGGNLERVNEHSGAIKCGEFLD
jgi:hypothetical protein